MKLAVTEAKGSALFIWKSSVWHTLELVFTSYLFLSPPHSRSFTITVVCSFFVSPYLSFLVLLLQFTLQLSLACFAEYVLHLTRLNPDMMYIHQDSGLVNVSYFKFDVDDTTGGCVHLSVRSLYIDIWIKRDQLDVTCFIISLFNAQHVSDVNTSIHQELATYLSSYFMGCIALVRCVLVLCCGLAVVVWYLHAGWGTSASACIRIPHHHSQTTT